MSITPVWENFTGLSVPCLDKKETDEIFLLLYIAIYSINEEDKPRKSKYFNMKFSNEQVSISNYGTLCIQGSRSYSVFSTLFISYQCTKQLSTLDIMANQCEIWSAIWNTDWPKCVCTSNNRAQTCDDYMFDLSILGNGRRPTIILYAGLWGIKTFI